MDETFPKIQHDLWFDDVNPTANAVVIDPTANKLLLIERRDSGDWALPGGFVDNDRESSAEAAIREVSEETAITVGNPIARVFRGVVDDPRNTKTAWIETDAYLFSADSTYIPKADDDARSAAWWPLEHLPPLYASHNILIERAVERTRSASLIDTHEQGNIIKVVDGGHMEYDKYIREHHTQRVFTKHHNSQRFIDKSKADRSLLYLEKEAAMMAHVRSLDLSLSPDASVFHDDALIMEALLPEDGWRWRADIETLDTYITDALSAFDKLERASLPLDHFPIESSYESFRREGWQALNDHSIAPLEARLEAFYPLLRANTQIIAKELLQEFSNLQRCGLQPRTLPMMGFCHHDARQANIAWHPSNGVKLVDWSWAGIGETGSDSTNLLIDLHKSEHDVSHFDEAINKEHCLTLIGFWLGHSLWPSPSADNSVRFQQFLSAVSAYEILRRL